MKQKKDLKTHNIVFRCNDEFFRRLNKLAKKENRNVSSLIRSVLTIKLDHSEPGNSK